MSEIQLEQHFGGEEPYVDKSTMCDAQMRSGTLTEIIR